MNRPDPPARTRPTITGIPGRTVAVPVWLLLAAGASLITLGAGVGAVAGALYGRGPVESRQPAGGSVPDHSPAGPETARPIR